MSVSTFPTENAWRELRIQTYISVDDTSSRINRTDEWVGQRSFRGNLEIASLPLVPEQDFTAKNSGDRIYIESHPIDSWPTVLIEYTPDLISKGFELRMANDSVDGWLLHTRVSFALARDGVFSIRIIGSEPEPPIKFELELDKAFFQFAKIARKLKFVEDTFNVKFSLPDKFSSEDLSNLEILFRGITEGEFSVRSADFTFPSVSPSSVNLSQPPFEGYGSFSHSIADQITLFGQQLSIGPVTVHLRRAELASPTVVEHIRRESDEPINIRFEVLDNQIVYCFENYVRQPKQYLAQRLDQFKHRLALEEPRELVDLIDESLQGDVSSDEAIQIAVGWQFYNRLPDRYCPQEPELNEATDQWHVPIWLVYTGGEGGLVGELIIDKKTGAIVSHTPIEEIRSKGMALAEKILHA